MHPPKTLVLTQNSRKGMKFGASFRFPAFPSCLFAMLAVEALAGGRGQFTTPAPCDTWACGVPSGAGIVGAAGRGE